MDYFVMRSHHGGVLKVGATFKLTAKTHNGKIGFAPELVYYDVEDKRPIEEIYDLRYQPPKPNRGVALFFCDKPKDMVEGEEWEVTVTSSKVSDRPDANGRKKFIYQVELKDRVIHRTDQEFDEMKGVWVSKVFCGKVLRETPSVLGAVRNVRYSDPSYPDVSKEYKEYLIEIAGKMEVQTRMELLFSHKNERQVATQRRETLGKLVRAMPNLCAVKRSPVLPYDGKTQSTRI